MSKRKQPKIVRPGTTLGRFLAGLRASSAAGKHGKKRKDRYNTKREAIKRDTES